MRTLGVSQPLTVVVLAAVLTLGAVAFAVSCYQSQRVPSWQHGTECNRYPTFGCPKGTYYVPATKYVPGHCCEHDNPQCAGAGRRGSGRTRSTMPGAAVLGVRTMEERAREARMHNMWPNPEL